jgi:hypothetical protein
MPTAGKMPVSVRSDHQPVSSVDFLKRQGCTYPELLTLPDFSGYPLLASFLLAYVSIRKSKVNVSLL